MHRAVLTTALAFLATVSTLVSDAPAGNPGPANPRSAAADARASDESGAGRRSGVPTFSDAERWVMDSLAQQRPRTPPPWYRTIRKLLLGGVVGGLLLGGRLDGFGLLDLIVVSAAILLAYRALSRYEPAPVPIGELAGVPQYAGTVVAVPPPRLAREPEAIIPVESGVDRIRQADSGFDPGSFATSVTRCFTAVQAAWTARNLWAAGDLLTDEMRERLQRESDRLRSQGHVNRVERIDIKRATIVDARQRDGWDIIAVDIEAMLIDYTTNESGLNVVEGNPFELVPFRECWEFVRPSGPNPWQVGGIR